MTLAQGLKALLGKGCALMSFDYRWRLDETPPFACAGGGTQATDSKGVRVDPRGDLAQGPRYGTIFAGGGGSSMGYRLAGYRQVFAVECDQQMTDVYQTNLGGVIYQEMVQDFKRRDLSEFHDLDLLDGSPPCSAFSMSGKRTKRWGQDQEWAEGAVVQRLEDLFFEFLDVVEIIRPKVVVAENVIGMICGKAKGYAKAVLKRLDKLGYEAQLFRLNSCTMGLPQARERVFYLATRRDLCLPRIQLEFSDPLISAGEALIQEDAEGPTTLSVRHSGGKWGKWKIPKHWIKMWAGAPLGGNLGASVTNQSYLFNPRVLTPKNPAFTVCGDARSVMFHWDSPRSLTDMEMMVLQSFPTDFDFGDTMPPQYVLGMSVPPVMMARIAEQIREQWFDQGTQANAA